MEGSEAGVGALRGFWIGKEAEKASVSLASTRPRRSRTQTAFKSSPACLDFKREWEVGANLARVPRLEVPVDELELLVAEAALHRGRVKVLEHMRLKGQPRRFHLKSLFRLVFT